MQSLEYRQQLSGTELPSIESSVTSKRSKFASQAGLQDLDLTKKVLKIKRQKFSKNQTVNVDETLGRTNFRSSGRALLDKILTNS